MNTKRGPAFPTSRPIRPFASIATTLQAGVATVSAAGKIEKKPIKIIEPPEGFKSGYFVLNLTQAELSRQDD